MYNATFDDTGLKKKLQKVCHYIRNPSSERRNYMLQRNQTGKYSHSLKRFEREIRKKMCKI